jgi:nucleoside-diphosphate-sugar epimerase
VNVQDVATAHVRALDSSISDGSSYILAAEQTTWKEVAQLLKKNYADGELFKTYATIFVRGGPIDGSKAEKELGIDYISLETTIKEVVDQNLGLIEARA